MHAFASRPTASRNERFAPGRVKCIHRERTLPGAKRAAAAPPPLPRSASSLGKRSERVKKGIKGRWSWWNGAFDTDVRIRADLPRFRVLIHQAVIVPGARATTMENIPIQADYVGFLAQKEPN